MKKPNMNTHTTQKRYDRRFLMWQEGGERQGWERRERPGERGSSGSRRGRYAQGQGRQGQKAGATKAGLLQKSVGGVNQGQSQQRISTLFLLF